jgi:hypothetical protein
MLDTEDITRIASEVSILVRRDPPPIQRDYTVKDIRAITGYTPNNISAHKFHGEYFCGGKRLFRREEIDYRRRMGLNIVQQ